MKSALESEVQAAESKVNWGQVAAFLGLTFFLTWLLDWFLWSVIKFGAQSTTFVLQAQMLIPAASAILLGVFLFPNSPIHRSHLPGRVAVFLGSYLLFTLIYAGFVGVVAVSPGQLQQVGGVGLALAVLIVVLVLGLRFAGGRQAFLRTGLRLGSPRYWLIGGVAVIAFYALQTLLNYLFGLGHSSNAMATLAQTSGISPQVVMISAAVNSVILGPIIGLAYAFGEEYGWRGYLQSELVKLGRIRGVLLLGVIWGIWHTPVIAMGYNYPGQPILGPILMTAYTVGLAFPLAYAVFKSGSVWVAAYLHGLNNQVFGFFVVAVYTYNDAVYSFGIGIFGILCLAVVDLLILRDPVWREPIASTGSEQPQEAQAIS